jgi:hypothetical protein
MSLVLLFRHLLLNMFRMLVHPSSGACDLLCIYFMGCIVLVRCVLLLRCGSTGVVWYPYAGWGTASACIRIPHHYLLLKLFRMLVHPSSGPCDLLWIYFMGCIVLVRCVLLLRCGSAGVVWFPYAGWTSWAVNSEIIKQVTSSWSNFIQLSRWCTVR